MNRNAINILFLTYFTDYSIADIFRALEYDDMGDFISDYLRYKSETGVRIDERFVNTTWQNVYERYDQMRFNGVSFVTIDSPEYPDKLKAIKKPPPMLYVKGRLNSENCIAVVGSRKVSLYAEDTVDRIVNTFAVKGYGIVSGLAYGIDKLAHEAALKHNAYTLAVLPNALDHIYPKEHFSLAIKIIDEGGGLMSELATGVNLGKKGFVQRNRLQSGVSEYVIPVEMGTASGTMHTVEFSIQQKKHLLIIRPDDSIAHIPEFEGIRSLLSNKYDKLHILPSQFTWDDIVSHREIKGSNVLLFDDKKKSLETTTEDIVVNDPLQRFRVEIDALYENARDQLTNEVKSVRPDYNKIFRHYQTSSQRLILSYHERYPLFTPKDTEKIAKSYMKALDTLIKSLNSNSGSAVENLKDEQPG